MTLTAPILQAEVTYPGTGLVGPFVVPFPYLDKSHVKVYVDDVATLAYTWATSASIQFTAAPAASSFILFRRETPTAPLVSIAAGSISPDDVNKLTTQSLYLIQEAQDYLAHTPRIMGDSLPAIGTAVSEARASLFNCYDGAGNPALISLAGVTAIVAATTLEVFLSKSVSLAAADAAAVVLGASLVIDANWALTGNTVLASKTVAFRGGKITRGAFNLTINGEVQAGDVAIFDKAGAGTVSISKGGVNVAWFSPTADGATDDSNSFNKAFAAGSRLMIRVPGGSYKCNATLPNEFTVLGDGSEKTTILPFNTAIAAWTFTYRGGSNNTYWAYNSSVTGVMFQGSGMVGIGFTMAQTVPANYTAGDENVGNITFKHCAFLGLDKGFQAPFGNIRKQFYECGFQGCNYGQYHLDAKFGGLMHAGNLYVTGGEFNGNNCGVYVDNVTDGFYAPVFRNTVWEGNLCNVRVRNATSPPTGPILFHGIGAEANGTVVNANVTLDLWTGTVKTTEAISTPIWYFRGSYCNATFMDSGVVGGIRVQADNTAVRVVRCRYELNTGFGGQNCIVDAAVLGSSRIEFSSIHCDAGGVLNAGCVLVDGRSNQKRILLNGGGFLDFVPHRLSTVLSLPGGVKVGFNSGTPGLTGGFAAASTNPAGGVTQANYSNYSRNWTAGQYSGHGGTDTALTAGFWVFTIATRTIAGAVSYNIWDQSVGFVGAWSNPSLNQWYTMGIIRQVNTTPTVFFDVGPGDNTTWTFDVQAFQARGPFPTLGEAQDFLASGVW